MMYESLIDSIKSVIVYLDACNECCRYTLAVTVCLFILKYTLAAWEMRINGKYKHISRILNWNYCEKFPSKQADSNS
jgi:hypothetical protein